MEGILCANPMCEKAPAENYIEWRLTCGSYECYTVVSEHVSDSNLMTLTKNFRLFAKCPRYKQHYIQVQNAFRDSLLHHMCPTHPLVPPNPMALPNLNTLTLTATDMGSFRA